MRVSWGKRLDVLVDEGREVRDEGLDDVSVSQEHGDDDESGVVAHFLDEEDLA